MVSLASRLLRTPGCECGMMIQKCPKPKFRGTIDEDLDPHQYRSRNVRCRMHERLLSTAVRGCYSCPCRSVQGFLVRQKEASSGFCPVCSWYSLRIHRRPRGPCKPSSSGSPRTGSGAGHLVERRRTAGAARRVHGPQAPRWMKPRPENYMGMTRAELGCILWMSGRRSRRSVPGRSRKTRGVLAPACVCALL